MIETNLLKRVWEFDMNNENLENGSQAAESVNKSEFASQALFSSKVRQMVKQYKDQILDLENNVRNVVAENFKYLDMPESGRITKIVEKHIANMNAEILGIKEELTAFELSNLELPKNCNFAAILKPISPPLFYFGCSLFFLREAATRYELSLLRGNKLTKGPKLIFHNNSLLQSLGSQDLHTANDASVAKYFRDSGSGKIENRGVYIRAGREHGYGAKWGSEIPAAGFYRMSSVVESIAGGVCYVAHNPGRHTSYEGDALRMWRVDSEGRRTDETNSEIRIQNAKYFASIRVGDFFSFGRGGYLHYGGHHLPVVDAFHNGAHFSLVGLAPLVNSLPINMSNEATWEKLCNVFTYYWTWRDECPTIQDTKNIESLVKFFICANLRAYHNVPATHQLAESTRYTFDIGLPRGCYHEENCYKFPFYDWSTGNYSDATFPLYDSYDNGYWTKKTGPGRQPLRIKHFPFSPNSWFGTTAEQEEQDRVFYRDAKLRGEPVIDIMEFFRNYGLGLDAFIVLGRFARDQKKFHEARDIAAEPEATESAKKNYVTLRNWFYTKWKDFRDTSGTDEVEMLSSKIIELIDSIDDMKPNNGEILG